VELIHQPPALLWEPSWEPNSVDDSGRPWTPMDPRARRSDLCGRSRTRVDTAWRSTDQEDQRGVVLVQEGTSFAWVSS
jgi:hypothetical protein